ncbi:MAG: aminoglycoside phosphotransferase family protein [Proteobacteria bacterium]|nr:aminoglycoside phosphotransferase family protein [Pseudomonadota bacterium]
MITTVDLRQAAAAFYSDGATCQLSRLGRGNINDTFLVESAGSSFVLQRINRQVFPQPLRVIDNFAKVTRHLSGRPLQTDKPFRTARPVLTLSGEHHFCDYQGEYWRAQTYLDHISCESLTSLEQAFQIGRTLACFHVLVADLDEQYLEDPLPGFHNLPKYLQEFDRLQVKTEMAAGSACRYCLEAIDRGRKQATVLEEAKHAGLLTIQIIHGDPKIDNFLFDDQGLADGMLDLDTVGAGIVHYDLGDCLRSCCNRTGESGGKDGLEVFFDMEICRALLAGYFSLPSQQLLSAGQRAFIFDAVMAITFELGLRFFTDHLRGNSYFKVRQDGENLFRAARQFRLVEDIIKREEEIRLLAFSSGC